MFNARYPKLPRPTRCWLSVINDGEYSGDSKTSFSQIPMERTPLISGVNFRQIALGIDTLRTSIRLPRHRHLRGYATVILSGRLDESGYIGRIHASAGDVLIHCALDCHANPWVSSGIQLIRLDWPENFGEGGLFRLDNVDLLARTAEKDVRAAALLLAHTLNKERPPSPGRQNDWPDLLAMSLAQNAQLEIGAWAKENGLAPETVSRGFAAAYGVAPTSFRGELRARTAWLRIRRSAERLCTIAADTGFADQAHMTRWVHRVTGSPPAAWRQPRMI